MGQEWERLTTKGSRKLLGLMELLFILTMVVVTKLCLSKLIGLYTKRENFTVCKLYLNKSDLKKKGRVHEGGCEETKEEKTMVVWSLNQKKKTKVSRKQWLTSVKCYREVTQNKTKRPTGFRNKKVTKNFNRNFNE